jgi:branched-chain amino acid transport system substrate-binding protein
LFVTSINEAKTAAKFLAKQRNIAEAGVFYINDDFGLGGFNEFKKSYAELGGQVVWQESWEKGGTNFRNALAKLPKNLKSLYIIGYEAGLGLAVKQAREAGFSGTIMTTVGLSVPPWRAAAGAAANGAYYTAAEFSTTQPNPTAQAFISTFKTKFQTEPNAFSAFAYDLATLVGRAAMSANGDPEKTAQLLASAPAMEGANGLLSFDANREVPLPLKVMQVDNGAEIPVQ